MFGGKGTERARIPCISVHNACSKFLLFAGNYAVYAHDRSCKSRRPSVHLRQLYGHDLSKVMPTLRSSPDKVAWQRLYLKSLTGNNTSTKDYSGEGVDGWLK